MNNRFALILAGGMGSRFWPLSRELEPKQFLNFGNEYSLFQQTIKRVLPFIPAKNILILGSRIHRFEIEKQALKFNIPQSNIILEPQGKNTAAAIGLGAKIISQMDPEAIMFVFPSDHLVKNQTAFLSLLKKAEALAEKDYLVTLGISPNMPHTGYGYIKVSAQKKIGQGYKVEQFVEKPNLAKAKKYLQNKNYYWNSGMFVWRAKRISNEIRSYLPALSRFLNLLDQNIDETIWAKITPVSIDYGVMEKAKQVVLLPAKNIGWSDLGSWQALADTFPKDKSGNINQGDCLDINSINTAVFSGSRLVATIGLKDVIISDTADALLVCDRNRTEEVKQIVQLLGKSGRQEHVAHKNVKRPWGDYTVLNTGEGFKVKVVNIPHGKRLSLQKHHRRSEHWVVVEGQATVTKDNEVLTVNTNESIYIPKEGTHRLENATNHPLKIIEVQCGAYLEEDDIERLEDDFNR